MRSTIEEIYIEINGINSLYTVCAPTWRQWNKEYWAEYNASVTDMWRNLIETWKMMHDH